MVNPSENNIPRHIPVLFMYDPSTGELTIKLKFQANKQLGARTVRQSTSRPVTPRTATVTPSIKQKIRSSRVEEAESASRNNDARNV